MFDLFSKMDYFLYKFSYITWVIWLVGCLPLVIIFYNQKKFRLISKFIKKSYLFICEVIKGRINRLVKFSNLWLVFIFLMVCSWNLWGLFPGLFGVSCQITFIILISFHFWFTIKISSLSYKIFRFFSHLTPQGAPLPLVFILNIIELVSNLIRPLTLTLRLCIKMTTGHILLKLLKLTSGFLLVRSRWISVIILIMFVGFYYLFEMVICFIQATVYRLLMSQYLKEHVSYLK
jgi:ATP synthase subunit 6